MKHLHKKQKKKKKKTQANVTSAQYSKKKKFPNKIPAEVIHGATNTMGFGFQQNVL